MTRCPAGAVIRLACAPGDGTAVVVEALDCPTCGVPAYRVRRSPGSFTGWRRDEGLWHACDTVADDGL